MIILHEAERVDGKGKVKGYLTKLWGDYCIMLENDENTAYPVIKESITPCTPQTITSDKPNISVKNGSTPKCKDYNNYSVLCLSCDYPKHIKCSKKVKKCVKCGELVEIARFDSGYDACYDCTCNTIRTSYND